MTIVTDILQQMLAVRQPQRKFLAMVFATILTLRGRVTGRNLSRYCDYSERTIARQFLKQLLWARVDPLRQQGFACVIRRERLVRWKKRHS